MMIAPQNNSPLGNKGIPGSNSHDIYKQDWRGRHARRKTFLFCRLHRLHFPTFFVVGDKFVFRWETFAAVSESFGLIKATYED
jgi:hypothetical protein